jgi:hypothetical protein
MRGVRGNVDRAKVVGISINHSDVQFDSQFETPLCFFAFLAIIATTHHRMIASSIARNTFSDWNIINGPLFEKHP